MAQAAIITLFERLIDGNPEEQFEKNPRKFYVTKELHNSIARDLSYLLNTRVAPFAKTYLGKIPYAYGVNLTAPTSVENLFEIQELESRIDNVIEQFEPRLANAKSRVSGVGSDPSKVFVNIDAVVVVGGHKAPLSFPVVVDM